MKDLFGETISRYYFHAPGWSFYVAVETVGSEFAAKQQTKEMLPDDSVPYQSPPTGLPVITLQDYLERQKEL